MKKVLIKIIAVKAFLGFMFLCTPQGMSDSLPQFELKDLASSKISSVDWKNKIVLIDFWATWCTSCKDSWKPLQELKNKYGSKGLKILAIAVDDSEAKVLRYAKKYDLPLDLIALDTQKVAEKFSLVGVPTTFLISNGKIVHKHFGPLSASKDNFEEILSKLF